MKTKICSKCQEEKLITEFHKHSCRKDGYADWCKQCRIQLNEKTINFRTLLKNGLKCCSCCKKVKTLDNFYKDKEHSDKRVSHCKDCKKLYMDKNKEKLDKKRKIYYNKHKEEISKKFKQYYLEHSKERALYHKNYQNNPEHKKRRAEQKRERAKSDINFKLSGNLRCRINQALNGHTKSQQTVKLLGCSVEFLKKHLENQFQPGMTWDNYTYYGWHVDHIIPCVKFDLSNPEEQKKCFHYTNLQPLWRVENQIKSDS